MRSSLPKIGPNGLREPSRCAGDMVSCYSGTHCGCGKDAKRSNDCQHPCSRRACSPRRASKLAGYTIGGVIWYQAISPGPATVCDAHYLSGRKYLRRFPKMGAKHVSLVDRLL